MRTDPQPTFAELVRNSGEFGPHASTTQTIDATGFKIDYKTRSLTQVTTTAIFESTTPLLASRHRPLDLIMSMSENGTRSSPALKMHSTCSTGIVNARAKDPCMGAADTQLDRITSSLLLDFDTVSLVAYITGTEKSTVP